MHELVTIYDKKGELHNGLYMVKNLAVGIRLFHDACQKDETINTHPDDFALYWVGTFDEHEGELLPAKRQLVIEAVELLRQRPDGENIPLPLLEGV